MIPSSSTFIISELHHRKARLTRAMSHVAMLKNAPSPEAAEAIVVRATREKIAKVLSVKVEDIEAAVPLTAYEVDSLVAVELRTWFFKQLGAEVAVFDIMSDSTIEALSAKVVAKSALVDLNNGEDKWPPPADKAHTWTSIRCWYWAHNKT